MKTGLLVMVHGSPRPASNRDMYAVVEIVQAQNVFDAVEVGFMECNEPDIPTSIETLVGHGVEKVIAVPYFLHSGAHVADDLPGLLEEAQQKYPDITFLMGDFLGHDPLIADVVSQRVREVEVEA
jgi:sirohydrochlorin ferrochelatase